MMTITINRRYYDDCTIGRLETPGFRCLTLELPWLDNCKGVSCIPAGTYNYNIAKSPRSGDLVLWLENVPDRSHIQIHAGNYTRQIKGCILVGDSIKYLDHDGILDITNSGVTLKKLIDSIPKHGVIQIL